MHSELRAQIAFRLTGLRADRTTPVAIGLRPALAARLRDLASLRYDFPVVLLPDGAARPLTEIVDELVTALTKDGENAHARAALLRLEREIRVVVAEGKTSTLGELWEIAAGRIAKKLEPESAASIRAARKLVKAEGFVVDCDAAFPRRFVLHAFEALQKAKATRYREEAGRLSLALQAILAAEDARSPHGRSAARLREGFGTPHRDSFDFDAMSKLLQRAPARRALTDARRRRIRSLMAALESQRFFNGHPSHNFEFGGCGVALRAFHARYSALRSLARALALARLEAAGEYDESRHAPLFRQMREIALTREELAQFPDYIVFVRENELTTADRADVIELLTSGIPVKIVLQSDDLLGDSASADGLAAIGARMQALTGAALGLSDVYVVQAAASGIPRMRDEIFAALAYPGPALVSVYSGAVHASSLPPYLNAAAATESRAFPSFTYDPRTAQYSTDKNPQPDRDWPVHAFEHEDASHQRVRRDIVFTTADFTAIDSRYARHYQPLPATAQACAVADCVEHDAADERTPAVTVVDDHDFVSELAVEETILAQARRARDAWRRLHKLANPPVVALKEKVEVPAAPEEKTAAQTAPAPSPAPEAKAAPSSDDPYIETPRCTTCNECTTINNKMFAYDANKQAYIADLAAGTYRQLVEAAESCQVSIIHPGKPRNPEESGMQELLERAAAFN